MAGDWMKIEEALIDKPEIFQIAKSLGVIRDTAVVLCFKFWRWAGHVTEDGNIKGMWHKEIDEVMSYPGFSKAMEDAGWLVFDSIGALIPNFDRHNSEPAKKRALAKERMKRKREKDK
jgi:hypothetical protein